MAKKDLAPLIYSRQLDNANKILLIKTVLRPIILYAAVVWGYAANSNIQKLQIVINKLLRSTFKFPWYVNNIVIHNTLNMLPLRSVIKKHSTKFYNSIFAVPNELLFTLEDYDFRECKKRPRATLNLTSVVHYRDTTYFPT